MPKLVCGLSKSVLELDGGTRGASVSLEIDLEPTTVHDAVKLKQHIRCGFERIREAIEDELVGAGTESHATPTGNRRNGRARSLPAR